jgi:hypothetical protein
VGCKPLIGDPVICTELKMLDCRIFHFIKYCYHSLTLKEGLFITSQLQTRATIQLLLAH